MQYIVWRNRITDSLQHEKYSVVIVENNVSFYYTNSYEFASPKANPIYTTNDYDDAIQECNKLNAMLNGQLNKDTVLNINIPEQLIKLLRRITDE